MTERPKRLVLAKRTRAALAGEALAKVTADLHTIHGRTPAEARDFVILEWLLKGDCGPLLAAIDTGESVGQLVFQLIGWMLRGDAYLPYHLVIKRHRGAPEKPGLIWRNWAVTLVFEKYRATLSSEAAFEKAATDLGLGVSSVRAAIRSHRNIQKRVRTTDK